MIRQEGGKWLLYSKDGKKKLGEFSSKKEAEDREREVNYFKHAKAEISLTITKASLQDDGTMRWQAVASDTDQDRTGERTSLALFQDWIERATTGKSVTFLAPPRRPFLGVSHYPDLDGFGEAGPTEKMYIDHNRFKAAGVFYGDESHPLGKALFEAVRKEREMVQRGEALAQPIRISAAWWDLAHSHGDFIFERKSLSDVCPMCAQGAGDKVYLKGQLDHFAATRVPINPRTALALEEKAMVKRVEDAASIVDDELAEQLEERARLVGKAETEESEGLVIKADEEPAVEKMEDEMDEAGPMSFAEMEERMRAGQMLQQAYTNWGMLQEVMKNILEYSQPDEIKARMQTALSEFGDRIGQLKAAVEDAFLIEPQEDFTMADEQPTGIEQAVTMLTDAINGDGDRAARLAKAQDAFNALAEVVKAQIDVVAPPDPNAEINKAILERLDLIASKLASPQVVQAPVQKSFTPTGPVQPQAPQLPVSPMTGKPSALRAMIERSVGMQ